MYVHGPATAGKNILNLYAERRDALAQAEEVTNAATLQKRDMTLSEQRQMDLALATVRAVDEKIRESEARNTINPVSRVAFGPRGIPAQKMFSADYFNAFHDWLAGGGQDSRTSASLYEGASAQGGYAVPIMVDGAIVPLAPAEMAVRRLATVIPTDMDIRIPIKGGFSVVPGVKAESGASPVYFQESDPTLGQFTLSAFMIGEKQTCSWELLQDVPAFQAFVVDDLTLAIQMLEESYFVTGTGVGEPQGLIGNVGAGVSGYPANGSTLLDATFDVMGTLNGQYWPGSSWLMSRATGVALKKLQKQANLFEPVFSNTDGQDYLHGRPVQYSASMPAIGASTTPILFGDFHAGYVIGDRGGSGINVKFLDQLQAVSAQLVILGYRRTDGRVRRSEAIQGITLASS